MNNPTTPIPLLEMMDKIMARCIQLHNSKFKDKDWDVLIAVEDEKKELLQHVIDTYFTGYVLPHERGQ